MTPTAVAYRARYVFSTEGKPLPGGIVTLYGNQVVSVGTASDMVPIDLENAAIIPGLVNAHTHLEFSNLKHPLGHSGQSLPDWIREVIAFRRSEERNRIDTIQQGLRESRDAGIALLGEICTDGWQNISPSRNVTLFQETICLDRGRSDHALQAQQQILEGQRHGIPRGISPHAPYTVHPQLLDELIDLAVKHQVPVAMHLAESPEEMELLHSGTGPFRMFLEGMGVWKDDANPQGRKPLDYLMSLSRAPRSLVIHGNYLEDIEFEFLAEHQNHMSVVYCPRTHAYFGHAPYPLAKMLARGVAVCLGTDSRASNPDLNLFEEAKFAAHGHPAVSPQQILRMATNQGKRALVGKSLSDWEWSVGFTIISLPDENRNDPFELLFTDESRVVLRETQSETTA